MTEEELRLELGRRLRARRLAQERTLAAVAVDAGLSVPYVANLESGRGNPTLGALHGLAHALDVPLAELVREDDAPPPAPASLVEFTAGSRFGREVRRLAREEGSDASRVRGQVLAVMAGIAAALPGRFDELDWHRVLDAIVLLRRPR
ncbi:MAG TPA: helix-turn-helix domain-containing protein [Terriglobales bacterium]|nr:helix-turn-helix domain-containing protein [Terriglobales bacterium]